MTLPRSRQWRLTTGCHSSRRRGRGAVLSGIVCVILSILGLNLALDTIKPEWRDPEYGHRLTRLQTAIADAPQKPSLVILGSSRAQMGLSPAALGVSDNAVSFNFSQAGNGPVHELLNLRRLLDKGIAPDYLLVEILPPVLGGESDVEKLMIPERMSYADLQRVKPYCQHYDTLLEQWLSKRYSPIETYRLNLMSHLSGGWLPWQWRQDFMWTKMTTDGWLPYFFPEVVTEKRQSGLHQAHAQYRGYFIDFHLTILPQRSYADLLELCREHDIQVAFFTMPESPTFRSWYTHKASTDIEGYFEKLREKVPVFDTRTWIDSEQSFADGHHLLKEPATQFSQRFGQECVKPWLSPK